MRRVRSDHIAPVLFHGWRDNPLGRVGLAKSPDLEPNSLRQNGAI
ncbi:hypothetical protein J2X72_001615 [Phyllobacterium sp. 1468]|nr:hypothetical protein [Phyllobacterium sp. 1468]